MISASRSHVATATGRTSAAASELSRGCGRLAPLERVGTRVRELQHRLLLSTQ